MTEFNPGDGWREWNFDTDRGRALSRERVQWTDASGFDHFFVRVGPVPPLPTAPYTVIRATWSRGARKGARDVLWLDETGAWIDREGTFYGSETAGSSISGFEVLAEPRAVTAKAVLDDVRTIRDIARGYGGALDAIGRDFGVES